MDKTSVIQLRSFMRISQDFCADLHLFPKFFRRGAFLFHSTPRKFFFNWLRLINQQEGTCRRYRWIRFQRPDYNSRLGLLVTVSYSNESLARKTRLQSVQHNIHQITFAAYFFNQKGKLQFQYKLETTVYLLQRK